MSEPSRPRPVPGPPGSPAARPVPAPPVGGVAAGAPAAGAVAAGDMAIAGEVSSPVATARLGDLDQRPVAEHVDVFEAEHARLERELRTIDQL